MGGGGRFRKELGECLRSNSSLQLFSAESAEARAAQPISTKEMNPVMEVKWKKLCLTETAPVKTSLDDTSTDIMIFQSILFID